MAQAVRLWGTRRYGLPPGARLRLGESRGRTRRGARISPARHTGRTTCDGRSPRARSTSRGFFSGEGCFRLRPRDARFVIKVRRDDRPLLEAFRSAFGIGSVCNVARLRAWSPAAVWHVVAGADVLEGIKVFESAGLLGRKQRQFAAWRPGAEAVAQAKIVRGPLDANLVAASRRALAAVSAYRAPACAAGTGSWLCRCTDGASRRPPHVGRRLWKGRLSCTSYQEARQLHPSLAESATRSPSRSEAGTRRCGQPGSRIALLGGRQLSSWGLALNAGG